MKLLQLIKLLLKDFYQKLVKMTKWWFIQNYWVTDTIIFVSFTLRPPSASSVAGLGLITVHSGREDIHYRPNVTTASRSVPGISWCDGLKQSGIMENNKTKVHTRIHRSRTTLSSCLAWPGRHTHAFTQLAQGACRFFFPFNITRISLFNGCVKGILSSGIWYFEKKSRCMHIKKTHSYTIYNRNSM